MKVVKMMDRDKVIKGLECHLKELAVSKGCKNCPYKAKMPCRIALVADVIEFIREQQEQLNAHEPRVLTLEEVPDAVFCYLEDKAYGTIEPAIFGEVYTDDTVAFTTLEDGRDYLDIRDYCKAWRCWTARPTDEQREATPWDEPSKEGDSE